MVTHHMTVATADTSGKPWSSHVFFVPDHEFNLYWVSFIGAVHSANIRTRPQVAITLLGGPPDHEGNGVYIDAEACELNDESEAERAIQVLHRRQQKSKFMVNSPVRHPGKCRLESLQGSTERSLQTIRRYGERPVHNHESKSAPLSVTRGIHSDSMRFRPAMSVSMPYDE